MWLGVILLSAAVRTGAPAAPARLREVQWAAERVYVAGRSGAWDEASSSVELLERACGHGAPCPPEVRSLSVAVEARDGVATCRAANALTRALAPAIDAAHGSHGTAFLPPQVRATELALDAEDPAGAAREAATLRALVRATSCPGARTPQLSAALDALQKSLGQGDVFDARQQLARVHTLLGKLETSCG